jgi:hypothetical protein
MLEDMRGVLLGQSMNSYSQLLYFYGCYFIFSILKVVRSLTMVYVNVYVKWIYI